MPTRQTNQVYHGMLPSSIRHLHTDNMVQVPTPEQPEVALHYAKPVERSKRGFGLIALPLAVAATAMGIYNTAQISFLKTELLEVKDNVNRLFEVVQQQEQHVHEIDAAIREISSTMLALLANNPGLFDSRLSRIENQMRDRLRMVTHALQAAQHRRLAIDYLSPPEIRMLFSKLSGRAAEFGCELLVKHHSDLFQLEVSLLFDGEDAHILLHVPMVPQHSLLRIFKLHPFPLPFFDNTFLIPDVKNDILAVSSTDQRFSAQLSSVDLMGCHRVNQIFMCDRFGVLSRRFNGTCLGALYMQDFAAAQAICRFEIVPVSEKIYQLKKNWFVVFLPKAVTVPVNCKNGSTTEMHLGRGSQRIHISPGCEANFPEHLIMADLSIKMPADILDFEWSWDPLTFLPMDEKEIAPELAKLRSFGLHRPTLSDLQFIGVHKSHTAGWFAHIIHFAGNTLLILLVLSIIGFLSYRLYLRRRNRSRSRTAAGTTDRELLANVAVAQALLHPPPVATPILRPTRAAHYNVRDETVQFRSMPYQQVNQDVEQEALRAERETLIKRLSLIDAMYLPTPSSPNTLDQ
jgi:cell division protein FtsL